MALYATMPSSVGILIFVRHSETFSLTSSMVMVASGARVSALMASSIAEMDPFQPALTASASAFSSPSPFSVAGSSSFGAAASSPSSALASEASAVTKAVS